jgi:GNAT superfamily N-acetyltransferase
MTDLPFRGRATFRIAPHINVNAPSRVPSRRIPSSYQANTDAFTKLIDRLRNSRLSPAATRATFRPHRDARGNPMSDRNPAELTDHPITFRLPGSEAVTVRPIRPDDAGRLQEHLRGLSPRSRRNRFLGAVSELPSHKIERLARMDRPDELALVAFADRGRDAAMIAEAIHVVAPGSARCEFALSVTDAWQRRGLGTLLLRLIECRARLVGARHLFGDVLRDNAAMKCLARKTGFSLRSPVSDARLVEIVKDLTLPQSGPPCDERFAQLRPIAA